MFVNLHGQKIRFSAGGQTFVLEKNDFNAVWGQFS